MLAPTKRDPFGFAQGRHFDCGLLKAQTFAPFAAQGKQDDSDGNEVAS